jgi:NADP-dependent 3-hydroxy acid dehydrogenase YdfG
MKPPGLFDIAGKVAIVTGAASGLGLAIAEAMAENGARVALFDLDRQSLDAASDRLAKAGADVRISAFDVSDRDQMRRSVDAVAEEWGSLDIVFGNAGIGGGPGFMAFDGSRNADGEIGSISDAQWDRVIAVNLSSVFATIQATAFHMRKQRSGRIIITTSIASSRNQGWVGTPYMPAKARQGRRRPSGAAGRAGTRALQHYGQRHRARRLRDQYWRRQAEIGAGPARHEPAHSARPGGGSGRDQRTGFVSGVTGIWLYDRSGNSDRRWIFARLGRLKYRRGPLKTVRR